MDGAHGTGHGQKRDCWAPGWTQPTRTTPPLTLTLMLLVWSRSAGQVQAPEVTSLWQGPAGPAREQS